MAIVERKRKPKCNILTEEERKQHRNETVKKYLQTKREEERALRETWCETQFWLEKWIKKHAIAEELMLQIQDLIASYIKENGIENTWLEKK
jgi:hypothetical protein